MTAGDGPGRPLPRPGPDGFSAWELAEHYRFPAGLDGSGISIALVRLYGGWARVAGSGAAVCMWAGLIARLQQAAGRPGLMVPQLYQTLGPRGALAPVGPGSARIRWSPSTGWGSPDGQRLRAALANSG